ncbi:hypothetical protein Tco_1265125 [Tanacetum coccineum]
MPSASCRENGIYAMSVIERHQQQFLRESTLHVKGIGDALQNRSSHRLYPGDVKFSISSYGERSQTRNGIEDIRKRHYARAPYSLALRNGMEL